LVENGADVNVQGGEHGSAQAITQIFLKVFKNSDGYNHTYGFQKSLVRSIDSQDF
jgi:hypothetical protein